MKKLVLLILLSMSIFSYEIRNGRIYYDENNLLIEEVDIKTFKILDTFYVKDKNNYYEFGNIVNQK